VFGKNDTAANSTGKIGMVKIAQVIMAEVIRAKIEKVGKNGTFSILGFGVGLGVDKSLGLRMEVWGLGKFNISVSFFPTFPFVLLIWVPVLPVPFLLCYFYLKS